MDVGQFCFQKGCILWQICPHNWQWNKFSGIYFLSKNCFSVMLHPNAKVSFWSSPQEFTLVGSLHTSETCCGLWRQIQFDPRDKLCMLNTTNNKLLFGWIIITLPEKKHLILKPWWTMLKFVFPQIVWQFCLKSKSETTLIKHNLFSIIQHKYLFSIIQQK